MEIRELIAQIFELCVVPLFSVITVYVVKLLNKKAEELIAQQNDQRIAVYIDMLDKTITECVIATNQTYVNTLKEKGSFDLTAQKEAFNRTYANVHKILTEESKKYLTQVYSDLNAYISEKIEAQVNLMR